MKVAEIKNGRKYKDRQTKSSYIKKDDAQFYMIKGKAELVYFCKANQSQQVNWDGRNIFLT